MDKQITKILDQCAQKHGVTIFEVISDYEKSIEENWNSEDEQIRKKWRSSFPNGMPTIEEFLLKVAADSEE